MFNIKKTFFVFSVMACFVFGFLWSGATVSAMCSSDADCAPGGVCKNPGQLASSCDMPTSSTTVSGTTGGSTATGNAGSTSTSSGSGSVDNPCIAGTEGAAGPGTCYAYVYGVKTMISYCTGTETSGPCRPNHVSQSAAQSLADQTVADGKAKGYDISCSVVKNSLGGGTDLNTGLGYYYDTVCTVNGLSGVSAETVENGGWNVLNCDLGHAGISTPSGQSSCSSSPGSGSPGTGTGTGTGVSTGLPTGGSSNPSSSGVSGGLGSTVASAINVTTEDQAASVAQQAATAATQHISSSAQAILNNIKVSTNYFVKEFENYKKSRGYGGSVASDSTETALSCSAIGSDLQLGSSGNDVLNLSKVLISEGLLSTITSTFDQTVFKAVVAYQEKYASAILTPVGLTSGTGFVGSATRSYMNTHAKCLGNGATTTSNPPATTLVNPTTSGSCGASGQSCCVYPSPSACATGLICSGATLNITGAIISGGTCK